MSRKKADLQKKLEDFDPAKHGGEAMAPLSDQIVKDWHAQAKEMGFDGVADALCALRALGGHAGVMGGLVAVAAQKVRWIAFADEEPPEDPSNYDGKPITRNVLVTNNIDARDAAGRMSHVWWSRPQRDGDDYVAFDDSMRKVERLTHWMDPVGGPQ